MAYTPESENPWKLVGIAKGKGPKPNDDIIVRRCEVARLIAKELVRAGCAEQDTETAHGFMGRTEIVLSLIVTRASVTSRAFALAGAARHAVESVARP